MTTIQQVLQQAKNTLAVHVEEPSLEAEVLLAHLLEKPRTFLYTHSDVLLSIDQTSQFIGLLKRRCAKEPIAYITGVQEFWSLPFSVSRDTLIPRPETELLVETILKKFDENEEIKVADLGTGSGAIAIAIAHERPSWQIVATDICEKSLQIAKANANFLGLNNISFHQGAWCRALPSLAFDLIVSNPPYIAQTEWEAYADYLAYEPKSALLSGEDGLDAIRELSREAKSYIKPMGWLMIEHGYSQGKPVCEIFTIDGYNDIQTVYDLAGRERVTIGSYGRRK